jgi:hypothetical protein
LEVYALVHPCVTDLDNLFAYVLELCLRGEGRRNGGESGNAVRPLTSGLRKTWITRSGLSTASVT